MKMKNPTLKQVSNSLSKDQLKKIKEENQNRINSNFIQQIANITGYRPVREYRFHPIRRWRIDFAIPEIKIAIEVEGGRFKKTTYIDKNGRTRVHTGGRHNTSTGFKNDMEKYNQLSINGWLLIRTTPEALLSEVNILNVCLCINNRIIKP